MPIAPSSSGTPAPPGLVRLSPWCWASVAAMFVLVLWGDLVRFQDPVGEKLISVMAPGSADFSMPFFGAYAMASGENPYLTRDPRFLDPWHREFDLGDGRTSSQVYLPTHSLIFVPLARVTGGDYRAAGRIWFKINVAILLLLAVVTWRLIVWASDLHALPLSLTASFLAIPATVLPLSLAGVFNLERGQSDALTALLCWGAVASALQDRPALSGFLALSSTLFKGYGVLFALGLGLILNPAPRRRAAVGASAAVILLLLPVAQHLPTAISLMRSRSELLVNIWSNHSFKNLVSNIRADWADAGQIVLTAAALAATAVCCLQARRSFRQEAPAPERALWLTLFTLCALGVVIGYLATSYVYNLMLVLPGTVILALGQKRLCLALGLDRRREWILGTAILLSAACLHTYRFGPRPYSRRFSPAGLGLVGVIAVSGTCALAALRRPARG